MYQVYVRSFADATGDGIGDLAGIRSRLDHIASLGVDAIWLNPCYPSPQHDHGYDVADYFDIHDEYGDPRRLRCPPHRRRSTRHQDSHGPRAEPLQYSSTQWFLERHSPRHPEAPNGHASTSATAKVMAANRRTTGGRLRWVGLDAGRRRPRRRPVVPRHLHPAPTRLRPHQRRRPTTLRRHLRVLVRPRRRRLPRRCGLADRQAPRPT